MTHSKGTLLELREDRIAGPCVWIIALAEELLNDGKVEMARSLSWNILSVWKELSREQAAQLQRIIEPRRAADDNTSRKFLRPGVYPRASVSESPTPNHRGES